MKSDHSRRKFLKGLACGSLALFGMGAASFLGSNSPATQAISASKKGPKPFLGTAVDLRRLKRSSQYKQLLIENFQSITPENELKMRNLRPSIDSYNFEAADQLFNFAKENNLLMRGHTLVWHEALPTWFKTEVTPENARAVLEGHIHTVLSRYKGRVHSWDVVNEAMDWYGYRETPWKKLLGPDYIPLAFKAAAEADPKALLVYNDYSLHSAEKKHHDDKRNRVLRLIDKLQSQNIRIDAVGIQGHLDATIPINEEVICNFIQDLDQRGVKILVTELDVSDWRVESPDLAERDELVAKCYEKFIACFIHKTNFIGCTTWGFVDKYSWLRGWKERQRADKLPLRPLLFDDSYQAKKSFSAVKSFFP